MQACGVMVLIECVHADGAIICLFPDRRTGRVTHRPHRPQFVSLHKLFEGACRLRVQLYNPRPPLTALQPDDNTLEDFDSLGQKTHLLVDLKSSGDACMEDFLRAGSIPVLFSRLAEGNPCTSTHSP